MKTQIKIIKAINKTLKTVTYPLYVIGIILGYLVSRVRSGMWHSNDLEHIVNRYEMDVLREQIVAKRERSENTKTNTNS